MKITNLLNLPKPFEKMAIGEKNYKPTEKRYSATTLLKSVREILLKRRYDEEIEQDCSEMIWALFGQAVHGILEKYSDGASEFAEEFLTVELKNGYTVSGKIDLYDMAERKVVDYKTASVWKVIHKDYSDWWKQGLIYAWLLWKNGLPCDKVEFYAILKDHSKTEAKFKPDCYPSLPICKIEFDVTDENLKNIDKFINDKVEMLAKYENVADEDLPTCTDEERWYSGDKYAVMKKGRKTALRVLETEDEAKQWQEENGGDFIEFRKGEDKKCDNYCLCCQKCDYWLKKQG